jgi:hypothetical protein
MTRGPEVASDKISSARGKVYILLHVCFAFLRTTIHVSRTPVCHGISSGNCKHGTAKSR